MPRPPVTAARSSCPERNVTSDDLAEIHSRVFPTLPRAWSAREIDSILTTRGSFLLTRPRAFLIGRSIAGETELLTLAVAPDARRQGLARALVQQFLMVARHNDAGNCFLEVASDNPGAQALYAATGWRSAGRRRNYYAPGVDALILTHTDPATTEIG